MEVEFDLSSALHISVGATLHTKIRGRIIELLVVQPIGSAAPGGLAETGQVFNRFLTVALLNDADDDADGLKVGQEVTTVPTEEEIDEAGVLEEIDRIIARLDVGIAEERKAMDALLSRLRTTRIAA